MKIKDFYEIVEQLKEPEASLLPNLQYRTQKFPFFQPDIYIYLKCLYIGGSENFMEELARLAPFVSDRKALFYYIMNDLYKQFQKKAEKRLTKNRTEFLINAFFDTLDENNSESLSLESLVSSPNMVSTDYFSYLNSMEDNMPNTDSSEKKITLETFVPIEEILNEDSSEQSTPDTIDTDEENIPLLKHQDIIDKFIEKAADEDSLKIKIEPQKEEEQTMSEDELDDPEAARGRDEDIENDYFFTQTLANIYIKQKKYTRAYEIIKHLSLNYPEKSIYFADQLSFLEKLIKVTNKK